MAYGYNPIYYHESCQCYEQNKLQTEANLDLGTVSLQMARHDVFMNLFLLFLRTEDFLGELWGFDDCEGHTAGEGTYHYHYYSPCINRAGESAFEPQPVSSYLLILNSRDMS